MVPEVCKKRAISSSDGAITEDRSVSTDPDLDIDNSPLLSKFAMAMGIFNSVAAFLAISASGEMMTS